MNNIVIFIFSAPPRFSDAFYMSMGRIITSPIVGINRQIANVTLKVYHTTNKKTTHRPIIGTQPLNDMAMFCDEKRQVRIKRHIRNV